MDMVVFEAPVAHISMLSDLRKIPFAKTDDGYRFAYWVYDLNDDAYKHIDLENSPHANEATQLLEKAKEDLMAILVTEDDYLDWTVHKKEAGGVAQYHKIIHDLSISLLMLTIDCTADMIAESNHMQETFFYSVQKTQANNGTKQVLNRHNPFADVTIKSQQFFYKTADGSTETLFFNTNDIVEKADKNGKDMLTMRPGFSVTKEHGVVQKPMQKVTFSNSVTESIVGDEDHIYIHID